jgi:hypothetical protein
MEVQSRDGTYDVKGPRLEFVLKIVPGVDIVLSPMGIEIDNWDRFSPRKKWGNRCDVIQIVAEICPTGHCLLNQNHGFIVKPFRFDSRKMLLVDGVHFYGRSGKPILRA